MDSVTSFLQNPMVQPLVPVMTILGLVVLLKTIFHWFYACYKQFLRPAKNLTKMGKWAIVTGATDGIGKAYSFEFARKGLNVLIISRTESKLINVKEEIMKKYPKVEVKYLAIDYSNFNDVAREKVATVVNELDCGVLVNNVGMSYPFPQYLHEMKEETVGQLVEMNITSTLYMTRLILPNMVKNKRGAIVNIASAACKNPSPLLSEYSAVKGFVEMFSRSLDVEYRPMGITVQCQVPLFVATKLAKIRHTSLTVPSPAGYARAAVSRIGFEDTISPFWSHNLQLSVMGLLPSNLLNYIVLSMHLGLRKAGFKKEAKKAAEKSN